MERKLRSSHDKRLTCQSYDCFLCFFFLLVSNSTQTVHYAFKKLINHQSFIINLSVSLCSSQTLCSRISTGFHGSGCSSALRTRVSSLKGSSSPAELGRTPRLCCSTICLWTACQSVARIPHWSPPASTASEPSPVAHQDSDSHSERPRRGRQSYK